MSSRLLLTLTLNIPLYTVLIPLGLDTSSNYIRCYVPSCWRANKSTNDSEVLCQRTQCTPSFLLPIKLFKKNLLLASTSRNVSQMNWRRSSTGIIIQTVFKVYWHTESTQLILALNPAPLLMYHQYTVYYTLHYTRIVYTAFFVLWEQSSRKPCMQKNSIYICLYIGCCYIHSTQMHGVCCLHVDSVTSFAQYTTKVA